MFNIKIISGRNSLLMGHAQSPYTIQSFDGLDGISVDVTMSQGFGQIGETLDNLTVQSRPMGIIGKIYNFKPSQLRELEYIFAPLSKVRIEFEEKYWIDAVVKNSPVFSYNLRAVSYAVQLVAPYPFWKTAEANYYKLGALTGGFNFPVNYSTPHNFAQVSDVLYMNCYNAGNTKVDYSAEIMCTSGEATNITLTNAQTQEFVRINTTVTAADTVRIFRENNVLQVTKTTNGIVKSIFADLDENSNLDYMQIGDNIIRADYESGAAQLVVAISFYDTLTGVHYGV